MALSEPRQSETRYAQSFFTTRQLFYLIVYASIALASVTLWLVEPQLVALYHQQHPTGATAPRAVRVAHAQAAELYRRLQHATSLRTLIMSVACLADFSADFWLVKYSHQAALAIGLVTPFGLLMAGVGPVGYQFACDLLYLQLALYGLVLVHAALSWRLLGHLVANAVAEFGQKEEASGKKNSKRLERVPEFSLVGDHMRIDRTPPGDETIELVSKKSLEDV